MSTLYFPILLFSNTPVPQQLPIHLYVKVSPEQAVLAIHSPRAFIEMTHVPLMEGVNRKLRHLRFPGITSCTAQTFILPPELCMKFTTLVHTATPEVVAMFEIDISTQKFPGNKKA